MTTTTLAFIAALLILPVIILLWATESKDQRTTRQVRACMKKGYSQRQTAAELGLTRYRVRKAIAA
jgi:ribosomal protein S14